MVELELEGQIMYIYVHSNAATLATDLAQGDILLVF